MIIDLVDLLIRVFLAALFVFLGFKVWFVVLILFVTY